MRQTTRRTRGPRTMTRLMYFDETHKTANQHAQSNEYHKNIQHHCRTFSICPLAWQCWCKKAPMLCHKHFRFFLVWQCWCKMAPMVSRRLFRSFLLRGSAGITEVLIVSCLDLNCTLHFDCYSYRVRTSSHLTIWGCIMFGCVAAKGAFRSRPPACFRMCPLRTRQQRYIQ